jgi:TnpA family transposase
VHRRARRLSRVFGLDGILDNQTKLPISKHTTDTAGDSLIFRLFDLLGLEFAPHLAGLPDRRLYRLGGR